MEKIGVERLLKEQTERVLLDVRTPAEFEGGHIPGAQNLPLFTNEERAIVGTMYKQQNPEIAFDKGLEFAGARMSWYVKEAKRLAPDRNVFIHCWRGGKRSGSLAWLLGFAGFEVGVLEGGYKAYRNYILNEFAVRPIRPVVLGGPTGSGKTEILRCLREAGEQVIDLEGLANHKGSSFGAIGESPQPTVEQFENNLYRELSLMDPTRRVWVENESRAIGRIFLPDGLWNQFQRSPLVKLDVPMEERVQFLVGVYGAFPKEALEDAFRRIERRLGGQHLKAALDALERNDFATAAEIALRYYDKSYSFATSKGSFDPVLIWPVQKLDPYQIANQLITLSNERGL
ncbi:MAG: tRNA 2-selenouridine(34) synthase MnmH [Haliscomenobacter sp.]|nr:tRNA 2-selenouridine(34) synthase MnmH [Haliscomenobacter sp.]